MRDLQPGSGTFKSWVYTTSCTHSPFQLCTIAMPSHPNTPAPSTAHSYDLFSLSQRPTSTLRPAKADASAFPRLICVHRDTLPGASRSATWEPSWELHPHRRT